MKPSSYDQRKYYFGVIVKMISKYRGWTIEFTHKWVKLTFNIPTTKGMTTVQFEDLNNKIRVFTNIIWKFIIPLPNEDLNRPNHEYIPPDIREPERYLYPEAKEVPAIEDKNSEQEDDEPQYCF